VWRSFLTHLDKEEEEPLKELLANNSFTNNSLKLAFEHVAARGT
jgi:hypothetical protein